MPSARRSVYDNDMILSPRHRNVLLLWVLVASMAVPFISAAMSATDSLRAVIRNKDFYVAKREARIATLKRELSGRDISPDSMYCLNERIGEEYRKFQIDSAIAYSRKCIAIAEKYGWTDRIIASSLRLAMFYTQCSCFLEAQKLIDDIDPDRLDPSLRNLYYQAASQLWSFYSVSARYADRPGVNLNDSVAKYTEAGSFSHRMSEASRMILSDSVEAERRFGKLFAVVPDSTFDYAILAHQYAVAQQYWGNREKARHYYTLSAIADFVNANRETASLQALADMLYEENRIPEALLYTQSIVDDIDASGISFRSSDSYSSHSIMSRAYRAEEKRAHRNLVIFLAVTGVGAVVLMVLVAYVWVQMRRTLRIKRELDKTNAELHELNDRLNSTNISLNDKNIQLRESNSIKQHYIAQFFDICFSYINKMEQNQNALYKLAVAKSYGELHDRLRSVAFIEEELDELYRRFDAVFLRLYPTFVTEFNALLRDDEKVRLKGDGLNKELRIYALLRLGISDSARIAGFLRCSTSTVYNYRTRMRNRSAVNRDDFETMIMKISASYDL